MTLGRKVFPRGERPTRRAVKERVTHWRQRLGLDGWAFGLRFETDADGTIAGCIAEPEYRQATLYFDLRQMHRDDLDHMVVHEMLHAVAWPLANVAQTLAGKDRAKLEWVRTMEEGLVTDLERIVLRLSVGAADR